jgi:hypothetical protein
MAIVQTRQLDTTLGIHVCMGGAGITARDGPRPSCSDAISNYPTAETVSRSRTIQSLKSLTFG